MQPICIYAYGFAANAIAKVLQMHDYALLANNPRHYYLFHSLAERSSEHVAYVHVEHCYVHTKFGSLVPSSVFGTNTHGFEFQGMFLSPFSFKSKTYPIVTADNPENYAFKQTNVQHLSTIGMVCLPPHQHIQ